MQTGVQVAALSYMARKRTMTFKWKHLLTNDYRRHICRNEKEMIPRRKPYSLGPELPACVKGFVTFNWLSILCILRPYVLVRLRA